MFEDLIDESKFKHLEEEHKACSGEECAVGPCSACTGSCQPEALDDELPLSFLKENGPDLKHLTLESQMYLKYELGHSIQKFYMPRYMYDCLEAGNQSGSCGVYKLNSQSLEGYTLSNLRTILIRKHNNIGKLVEYIELVEVY